MLRGVQKFCDCVPQLDQKRGHHKIERYVDNSTDHKKILDDGDDVLDEEQFDRKKSSIHSALDKAYGTKNALTRDEIDELINDTAEDDKGNGESDDDDTASSGAEEAALQQKSEIHSAGAGIFGFSKYLAASSSNRPSAGTAGNNSNRSSAKGTGTAGHKSSAKGTGTATTPKTYANMRQVCRGKMAKVPRGVKKGNAGESSALRHLDGRNERLHMNVKEDLDKIKKSLEALKEKLTDADDSDSQSKKFQTLIKDIINMSREVTNDTKAAAVRITRSKSDHDMSEQVNELKVLSV